MDFALCIVHYVRLPQLEKIMQYEAFQDGAQFYDSFNGALIAEYRDMVANDADLEGAKRARKQFLADHPKFVMEYEA